MSTQNRAKKLQKNNKIKNIKIKCVGGGGGDQSSLFALSDL